MTLFSTPSLPFLRRLRRKKRHKAFVYDSMLEQRNQAIRLLLSIDPHTDVEVIRRSTIKPYLICRVPKGDLYLLKEAKRKFLLATKYKRRLLLLNF
jgi:hypothetical protein|tara:strand:+ start:156 stop:443 length:288 start_codon:yes stop_codon:yes gene_type:complete